MPSNCWRIVAALVGLWLGVACDDGDGDSLLGVACDVDADCRERGDDALVCGLALEPETVGPAELACATARGPGVPGDACEGPDDCEHGLCLVAGICAAACVTDDDCRAEARCTRAFARAQADGAVHLRACIQRIALPDSARVDRWLLPNAASVGERSLSLDGTDVPAVYVVEHLADDRFPDSQRCRPPLCATRLTSDDGPLLFEADSDGPSLTPIASPSSAFPLTVYIGNGSEPVYADGYQLSVEAEAAGDLSVTRLRGQPTGGRLDLNLFHVGTDSLDGAAIDAALATVDAIFAPADIYVGEVSELRVPSALVAAGDTFDAPDEPGAGFDVLAFRFGVWAELPALLALSAGIERPGVNLFFVRAIDGMGTGNVQALSGGTPGPLGMHGTGASGIAVAIDAQQGDPKALGRTLAHELGHYLGLFHTSERDGRVLDALSDTPSCTANQDRSGDGVLSAEECAQHGADNLMFWAQTDATVLSAEQIRVLQQAMLLQ